MKVPFNPGYCYAAYKANDSSKVYPILSINCINSKLMYKVPTVNLYASMPQHLIYHACSFHVMDFKVFSFNYVTNIIPFNCIRLMSINPIALAL